MKKYSKRRYTRRSRTSKNRYTKRRTSKRRTSKRRYTKRRYTKRRYTKRRTSKRRTSKRNKSYKQRGGARQGLTANPYAHSNPETVKLRAKQAAKSKEQKEMTEPVGATDQERVAAPEGYVKPVGKASPFSGLGPAVKGAFAVGAASMGFDTAGDGTGHQVSLGGPSTLVELAPTGVSSPQSMGTSSMPPPSPSPIPDGMDKKGKIYPTNEIETRLLQILLNFKKFSTEMEMIHQIGLSKTLDPDGGLTFLPDERMGELMEFIELYKRFDWDHHDVYAFYSKMKPRDSKEQILEQIELSKSIISQFNR